MAGQTQPEQATEAQGSGNGIEPQVPANKDTKKAGNRKEKKKANKGDRNQESQADISLDEQDVNDQDDEMQEGEPALQEEAHQENIRQENTRQAGTHQKNDGDDNNYNNDNRDEKNGDDKDDGNETNTDAAADDDSSDDDSSSNDDDSDNDDDSGNDDGSDDEEAEHDGAPPKRRENPHLAKPSGPPGKAEKSTRATSVEFEEHAWATPSISNTENVNVCSLTLARDPDCPEKSVRVQILGVLAFRQYLLVLAPSLSEAKQYERALLIRSGEHKEQTKLFTDKHPHKLRCADPSELPEYEGFVLTAVAVSPNGSKRITFVTGYEKGNGKTNMKIWTRTSCNSKWGTEKTTAMLNAQRTLVGQKKLPDRRKGHSAETSVLIKEFYRTRTGKDAPPRPREDSPLYQGPSN